MKPNPKLLDNIKNSADSAQHSSAIGKGLRILIILSLEDKLKAVSLIFQLDSLLLSFTPAPDWLVVRRGSARLGWWAPEAFGAPAASLSALTRGGKERLRLGLAAVVTGKKRVSDTIATGKEQIPVGCHWNRQKPEDERSGRDSSKRAGWSAGYGAFRILKWSTYER